MVIFFPLNLKQIFENAKDYNWPRPACCGQCNHLKVWGHGFVFMFFEGYAEALMIRRYRCPCCGCVIRIRPSGYFKGHQNASTTIRHTLIMRLQTGHWPRGGIAARGHHWLRALKRNAMTILGKATMFDLIAAFDKLVDLGLVPVSRAIQSTRI